MGNFYVNFAIKTEEADSVVEILRQAGRKAYVTPNLSGYVLVADALADMQDPAEIHQVGQLISGKSGKPVLAILNHDDDILHYWLFDNGQLTDEYDSSPGYFSGEDNPPSGGNAQLLCETFDRGETVDQVKQILADWENYTFAFERHLALAEALGLPEASAGFGYQYIEDGDIEDIDPEDLIHIP